LQPPRGTLRATQAPSPGPGAEAFCGFGVETAAAGGTMRASFFDVYRPFAAWHRRRRVERVGRAVGTRPLTEYSRPALPGKIAKILTCALGARVAYLCEGANSGSNFGAKRDIVFV